MFQSSAALPAKGTDFPLSRDLQCLQMEELISFPYSAVGRLSHATYHSQENMRTDIQTEALRATNGLAIPFLTLYHVPEWDGSLNPDLELEYRRPLEQSEEEIKMES